MWAKSAKDTGNDCSSSADFQGAWCSKKTKTQLCRVNYCEVFGPHFNATQGNITTESHLDVGGEDFANTNHRPLLQKITLGSWSQSHMGEPCLSCLYFLAWRVSDTSEHDQSGNMHLVVVHEGFMRCSLERRCSLKNNNKNSTSGFERHSAIICRAIKHKSCWFHADTPEADTSHLTGQHQCTGCQCDLTTLTDYRPSVNMKAEVFSSVRHFFFSLSPSVT